MGPTNERFRMFSQIEEVVSVLPGCSTFGKSEWDDVRRQEVGMVIVILTEELVGHTDIYIYIY